MNPTTVKSLFVTSEGGAVLVAGNANYKLIDTGPGGDNAHWRHGIGETVLHDDERRAR